MLKVQEIRELIKLIDESTIDEFEYESNGTKVSMKKQNGGVSPVVSDPTSVPVQKTKVEENEKVEPVQTNSSDKEETESNQRNYDHEIVSPMVGTYYSSPSPESENYVQKGDKVKQNTVVCIVEAMKLFNEIEAEANGEIVEILVENGELVEYGQPLFRVKTE